MRISDGTGYTANPYGAMLRGGAVPGTLVGVVSVALFTVIEGWLGLAGSLLALGVVLASFASTMVLLRRLAGLDPRIVFLGAMVGYMTKVGVLGLFLLLFRHAEWLSNVAFAITAIVVSLSWTIGEVIAFTRVRTLIYDEPAKVPTA